MVDLKESTVLVVDDEPDLCDMVAFEFKLQGSRVFAANNGRSALGIVESHHVNAVITDIRMAGYNGIELLDNIRSRNISDPAVFFITAYESDLAPSEAYHRGAEGIFPKPFSLKSLVDNVQKVLAPPKERWAHRPASMPAWIIERQFPSVEEAREESLLQLGRGGFALTTIGERPRVGELTGFKFVLKDPELPLIEGTGTVRWVRPSLRGDTCVSGIEFDYLSDACRSNVLDWIDAQHFVAYIPRM